MNFKLADRYKHKIKTVQEISEIIGPFPRLNKVIMCHGVFDVVHPGHLRHLIHAKSKADILIASVTADKHINKGIYRPHVPQELRAVNLAAYEIIDYVFIDENETPLNNLEKLKPDLFAKGYEYTPTQEHNQKTIEEVNTINNYGGEVIFTPGDIVYSSSSLIELSPPELKIEKLIMLMSMHSIKFSDLYETIKKLKEFSVHVVGDTIIDSITKCEVIGGQIKTPTISVKFDSQKDFLGGAGIVAEHINAAGAQVKFTPVVGDDSLGKFTIDRIEDLNFQSQIIVDYNRPTTHKNAIVVDNYRLLKIDNLDNASISNEILEKLINSVKKSNTDAIIFSDFRHGIFNKRTINPLISAIPKSIFKVADSQVASRWGNILDFKGFNLVTPNEREARFALADQDSGIRPLAIDLYEACKTDLLILKLGSRGILTCLNGDHASLDSFLVMDSFADQVIDPVGAGDALIAYSTLAMLASNNAVIASILGNLAAGCECEFDGNIPITPDLIEKKLRKIQNSFDSNF